jgi:UDP-4-amino-4,6-dideoxy-N-acetyl-beta-L-altrosamine N-acetyltransferase
MKKTQLRPMLQADLEMVLDWRNHPDVRRYMYTQQEIGLDEHRRWFEQSSSNSDRHLLVFELDDIPMGFVNFNHLGKGSIVDWGFYAAPDVSKGGGRLLGLTALSYAFNELAIHKVCGQVLAYNKRSINFHQRLGFLQEGVMRDQYFDGGHYHSVVCFGLLEREWQSFQLG